MPERERRAVTDTELPTRDTPEERIAALVDAVKLSPYRRDTLVELLPERIDLYTGRSTNATVRMRGYILAAFEQVGLPPAALPYVLEELQNSRHAYLVAAAARALRGYATPSNLVVPYVLAAIANVRYVDDAVSFDSYKPHWPAPGYTTALAEIFATLAWLAAHAQSALTDLESLYEKRHEFSPPVSAALARAIEAIRASRSPSEDHDCGCCCADADLLSVSGASAPPAGKAAPVPGDVELQDQDGQTLRYADFFTQSPAIVVFFYTRCDNPNKCSLTITKLAQLQGALDDAGSSANFKVAAISYDPGYDLPARLKAYGLNRGMVFGENARFFRTTSDFAVLRDYFQLGVNFGEVLVNRHAIELFILDDSGRVVDARTRLQWDPREVLDATLALLKPSAAAVG